MSTFDGLQYIASYPDLIAAFGANAAAGEQHYLSNGQAEGRQADLFGETQYLRNYGDLQGAFGSDVNAATAHFISNGFAEGRVDDAPSPAQIDGLQYIASNADLIAAFGPNAAAGQQHYVDNGQAEGRVLDNFNETQYLANYADLQAAFGTNGDLATQHYITNGFAEGRTDDGGGSGGDPLWANGLEILPLGDSITRGSGSVLTGGYRGPLDTLFNNAGLPVDFVGRLQGGPIPDPDHEGVSGRSAAELTDQVTGIIDATRPEAVLLLIGTVDVEFQPNAASTVPGDIVDIVNQVHAVDPSTHVLVATLPFIARPDVSAVQEDVSAVRDATNAGLVQAINQLAAQGSEVSLVDTSSIGPEDLVYDAPVPGVQLNRTGHAELAQAWFNAILDVIPPPSAGVALASVDEAASEAAFNHDTGFEVAAAVAASDFNL